MALDGIDAIALVLGGFAAGIVNTLAGGGSLLSVPLLVLVGLPGTLANGTNRVGILFQSLVATFHFRSRGVLDLGVALRVLAPLCAGSLVGAGLVSRVDDAVFERSFGLVMLVLLVPTVRGLAKSPRRRTPWPVWLATIILFGIGLYGGSFQAGVGLFLLAALERAGLDLVRANAIKMLVVAALTLVALPVFLVEGQIAWDYALVLAFGYSIGGSAGARLAMRGGERLIRGVMAVAVVALAGRMFGLYGT